MDIDLKKYRHWVIWLAKRRINKWKKPRILIIERSILDVLALHSDLEVICCDLVKREAIEINKIMKQERRKMLKKNRESKRKNEEEREARIKTGKEWKFNYAEYIQEKKTSD